MWRRVMDSYNRTALRILRERRGKRYRDSRNVSFEHQRVWPWSCVQGLDDGPWGLAFLWGEWMGGFGCSGRWKAWVKGRVWKCGTLVVTAWVVLDGWCAGEDCGEVRHG